MFFDCFVLVFFFFNLLNMYLCCVLFCLLINEVILCKTDKKSRIFKRFLKIGEGA